MYLAAIADSQPQPPTMHAQFPNAAMQQGPHYMQHQQAQQMTPQSLMAARSSMLYSQQSMSALQQQQALHSQLGMSSGGSGGLHMMHNEGSVGGNAALTAGGYTDYNRNPTGEGANKEMGTTGSADGRRETEGGGN